MDDMMHGKFDELDEFDDLPDFERDEILSDYIGTIFSQIKELEQAGREEFTLNPVNHKRFVELYALTAKFCQLTDAKLISCDAEPRLGNNGIVFQTPMISIGGMFDGEALNLFRAMMNRAHLVSIDPIVDDEEDRAGLEIGLSVKGVWILPNKK